MKVEENNNYILERFEQECKALSRFSVNFEENNDNGKIDYFIRINDGSISFESPLYPDRDRSYPETVDIWLLTNNMEHSITLHELNAITHIFCNYDTVIKEWLKVKNNV